MTFVSPYEFLPAQTLPDTGPYICREHMWDDWIPGPDCNDVCEGNKPCRWMKCDNGTYEYVYLNKGSMWYKYGTRSICRGR